MNDITNRISPIWKYYLIIIFNYIIYRIDDAGARWQIKIDKIFHNFSKYFRSWSIRDVTAGNPVNKLSLLAWKVHSRMKSTLIFETNRFNFSKFGDPFRLIGLVHFRKKAFIFVDTSSVDWNLFRIRYFFHFWEPFVDNFDVVQ